MGDADPVRVRLSALCGRPAVDGHGRTRGTVLDVRVVQDGPLHDGVHAALRVDGVVIGRGQLAERFGLFRRRVHGPWLLVALDRLLGPERTYLPWSQVTNARDLAAAGTALRFTGETAPLPG